MYNNLIINKIKAPTAIDCWIYIYPFQEKYDWKEIYNIPFKYVRESYLQSFPFKIINIILNTNEKLYNWLIKQSTKCNFCESIDTIEHHLYQCIESKRVWNKMEWYIYQHLEIKLRIENVKFCLVYPTQKTIT